MTKEDDIGERFGQVVCEQLQTSASTSNSEDTIGATF
jgi:hypothetical protein